MDRTEPRVESDLHGLAFRRRAPRWSEPETDSRFAIAVAIFLLAALVYPWYSYWVQSQLLARHLHQGVESVSVLDVRDGGSPLAIVDLGHSSLWEVDASICRQAGQRLRRSVAGQVIRVQSAQASGTRAPVQQLACP